QGEERPVRPGDREHDHEDDGVLDEAGGGGRVLVRGVLGRLPAARPGGVAEQREHRDEDRPRGELAAPHDQPAKAVASGACAKRIPAAPEPCSSSGSSPTCTARPGSTPRRSSASRNGAGSGLAAPASALVTTAENRPS